MKPWPMHVYRVMSKTLEIPDALYEALEKRAASEDLTLSDLAVRSLERELGTERPTSARDALDELRARLRARPPIELKNSTAAELLREGREEREEQLWNAVHHP
ncbi:MAG: hypothetical protein JWN02_447 [Acidobacteria bacterium]|nr:hypothetical protein [Acidobacteriota bacterium]